MGRPAFATDRSIGVNGSLPVGWGPGPWDDDGSWEDKVYRCGDLRPWPTGASAAIGGRRICCELGTYDRNLRQTMKRRRLRPPPEPIARLLVQCWCGDSNVTVPRELVAHCRTVSCDLIGCRPGCRRIG